MVEPIQQPEADKIVDLTEMFFEKVKKSQNFGEFRAMLGDKIANAKLVIDSIFAIIRANVVKEGQVGGFLTAELEDYLECLKCNVAGLDSLLDSDSKIWTDFSARA